MGKVFFLSLAVGMAVCWQRQQKMTVQASHHVGVALCTGPASEWCKEGAIFGSIVTPRIESVCLQVFDDKVKHLHYTKDIKHVGQIDTLPLLNSEERNLTRTVINTNSLEPSTTIKFLNLNILQYYCYLRTLYQQYSKQISSSRNRIWLCRSI